MRTAVSTVTILLAVAASLAAQERDLRVEIAPARRVALVIGNNDYQHAPPLRNAANDARDLGAALQEVDFDVEVLVDADLRTLEGAINRFVASIQPGDVALFHYSGHGIAVSGENYLIPVDFELTDQASVRYDAYSASKLHDRLAGAGSRLSIVTLDACRNNGFESSRSNSGGLAGMNAAEGAFIAFATGPGMTADDNLEGRNGLFTGELLEALQEPGLSLDEVFNRVRRGVYEASGRKQLPWSSSSVIGGFYFRTPEKTTQPVSVTAGGAAEVPADQAWRLELAFWEAIRDGDNPAMFESYLSKYPEGHFAELARIKLDEVRAKAQPAAAEAEAEATAAEATPPPAQQPQTLPEQPPPASAQPAVAAESQRSVADLPLMRGTLGVQTRVARNIEELQLLAASGDRNYSVFALPVSESPQSIGTGGWKLQLEKSDPKKGRFTVYTVEPADPSAPKRPTLQPHLKASEVNEPVRHEHKNAAAYHPIQFNRSSPAACDEIVVLSIEANRVVGYLAESR